MKIGSLWKRDRGPVATGYISLWGTEIKIAVWENDKKDKPTSPDFNITVSDSQDKREAPRERLPL